MGTRPDLAFAVATLSKFNALPSSTHMAAALHVVRYLRATPSMGITYSGNQDGRQMEPIGFTDSDFAGDRDDRKSTSGYVFTLAAGAVSWRARKQPLVASLTVEAEYIGASDAAKESIWIRNLYADLGLGKWRKAGEDDSHCRYCLSTLLPYNAEPLPQDLDVEPQLLYVDNQGASQLARNPRFHERTKHISIRYHFVRDACERRILRIEYLHTSEMTADIMIKALPRDTHWKHTNSMGLFETPSIPGTSLSEHQTRISKSVDSELVINEPAISDQTGNASAYIAVSEQRTVRC